MQIPLQNLPGLIYGLLAVCGVALCLATCIAWLGLLLKTRAKLAETEKLIARLCL
jgi:hypothetical protein